MLNWGCISNIKYGIDLGYYMKETKSNRKNKIKIYIC